MKKITRFTILFAILIGVSACSPKLTPPPVNDVKIPVTDTAQPPVTEPKTDYAQSCANEGGKWINEYKECEGVDKTACEKIGGKFNECASACRHDPTAEMCTMQCVLICEFGQTDISNPPIVGGDRDEHGCIGSAGYTWCENKQKCLRSWEENCSL